MAVVFIVVTALTVIVIVVLLSRTCRGGSKSTRKRYSIGTHVLHGYRNSQYVILYLVGKILLSSCPRSQKKQSKCV